MTKETKREETTEYSINPKKLTVKKKKTIKWFNLLNININKNKTNTERRGFVPSIPKGFAQHYENVKGALMGRLRVECGDGKIGSVDDSFSGSIQLDAKEALAELTTEGKMPVEDVVKRLAFDLKSTNLLSEDAERIVLEQLLAIQKGKKYQLGQKR